MTGPAQHDLLRELFIWLTQPEWKLCSSLILVCDVEGFTDSYDLAKFATPDMSDAKKRSWAEAYTRAIRLLSLEGGYEFEGLDVRSNGRIITKGVDPVCVGNAIYRDAISSGNIQYDDALRVAIEMVESREIRINADPLRQVLEDMIEAKKWAVQDTDPAKLAAWERLADESLRELGIARVDYSKTN